jgi:hypothetical protein
VDNDAEVFSVEDDNREITEEFALLCKEIRRVKFWLLGIAAVIVGAAAHGFRWI